jgi:hypothetical protein
MNKERLLRFADFVEARTDYPFNMARHETCLLDYAARLFLPAYEENKGFVYSRDINPLLDFDTYQGDILFLAPDNGLRLSDITREMAVRTLRKIAETGVVTWG